MTIDADQPGDRELRVGYFRVLLAAIGLASLALGFVKASTGDQAGSWRWAMYGGSVAIGAISAGIVGVLLLRLGRTPRAGSSQERTAAWRVSTGVLLGGLGAFLAGQLGEAALIVYGGGGALLTVVSLTWPSSVLRGRKQTDTED